MGHKPGAKYKYSAPPVFLFEPHQPEQCNYKPDLILKIDEVWEQKYKAFQILAAQKHLWGYYERVALNRGIQGSRNTGVPMTYGEAYQRLFPRVDRRLVDMKPTSSSATSNAPTRTPSPRSAELGVSTVHEALGRSGLMKPYMRPIWAGAPIAGPAVTVLAQPGDNWMIHVAVEQCQKGDILVVGCTTDNTDGMFGELLADLAEGARRGSVWSSMPAAATSRRSRRWVSRCGRARSRPRAR